MKIKNPQCAYSFRLYLLVRYSSFTVNSINRYNYMYYKKTLALMVIVSALWSCGTQKKIDNIVSQKEIISIDFSAGPTTYIYKTTSDYYNLVPIILSDDKTVIVSFPHPRDVYYKGALAYPTQLEDGYLLDNRGISPNVAFLNISFDEYSKLKKAPSIDSLFGMIIDNNPLLELYNCGTRYQYKDEVAELNNVITNRQLTKCKKIVGK